MKKYEGLGTLYTGNRAFYRGATGVHMMKICRATADLGIDVERVAGGDARLSVARELKDMAKKRNRGKDRKSRARKNRTAKNPGKSAVGPGKPSGPVVEPGRGLPDPRSMESAMSRVMQTAFPSSGGGAAGPDADRLSRLSRAQDIVYDAWEAGGRRGRISLAKEALDLSDLCADAWVILAEETADIVEARELFERAVAAGEEAVRLEFGPDALTEHAGYFWKILHTRPYMRALADLSGCMWGMGEKEESVALLREMLRLNPNDNQGMRSPLVFRLFCLGDLDGVEDLLETYREPMLGEWGWNMALLLFRRDGDSARAASALDDAFETNPFVPGLLTGARRMPASMPEYYSPGSLEEAVFYVFLNAGSWSDTKGALIWVSRKTRGK